MFSPPASGCLIEESLPLCVVSLELNGRQPPKVRAEAFHSAQQKKAPSTNLAWGPLLSALPLHTYPCPRANREVPGAFPAPYHPLTLIIKEEPPVESSKHELVKITLLIG